MSLEFTSTVRALSTLPAARNHFLPKIRRAPACQSWSAGFTWSNDVSRFSAGLSRLRFRRCRKIRARCANCGRSGNCVRTRYYSGLVRPLVPCAPLVIHAGTAAELARQAKRAPDGREGKHPARDAERPMYAQARRPSSTGIVGAAPWRRRVETRSGTARGTGRCVVRLASLARSGGGLRGADGRRRHRGNERGL